ncbi:MAG: hypothetical protein AAF797_00875 [Planctomycetota bacterium]
MSVYGMDLRRKIVAALDRGETVTSVARRFEADQKTVRVVSTPGGTGAAGA